jgi:CRP-like cAMP-binding protein
VLRKDAKLELLRRVPFFSACSKRELQQIARISTELDVPARKTLIKEGQPGHECFVMIDGEVEVTRNNHRVPIRGGSELFGEMALLTHQPRNATVSTRTQVRALVLTSRDFRDLVNTTPAIALKVMRSLAERLETEESH